MNDIYTYLQKLRQKIKKLNYLHIIGLGLVLLTMIIIILSSAKLEHSKKLQNGIASEIIRFHVIANSDSKEDQDLKMLIKDKVTNYLEPLLNNINSVEDARMVLYENLDTMERLANEAIINRGFNYSAKASLENVYFPLRVYGDIALPPGEYESVRIELGNSSGKNWWCIMFPPLCFVDSTYSVVPDSSKDYLKEALTDEEYDEILIEEEVQEESIDIKPKFKIFTFFNDIFNLE